MKENIFCKKGKLKVIITLPGYLKKHNDTQRWQHLPLGVVLKFRGIVIFSCDGTTNIYVLEHNLKNYKLFLYIL